MSPRTVSTALCASLPARVPNRCPPLHRRTLPGVLRSPRTCTNRQRIWPCDATAPKSAEFRPETEPAANGASEGCVKRRPADVLLHERSGSPEDTELERISLPGPRIKDLRDLFVNEGGARSRSRTLSVLTVCEYRSWLTRRRV